MILLAPGDRTRSFSEVKLGKRALSVKAANQRPDPHQASNLHVPSTYDLHDGEESRRPEPAVHMLAGLADLLMIRYKVRCTVHPALRPPSQTSLCPLFALHTHTCTSYACEHTLTLLYTYHYCPSLFETLVPPLLMYLGTHRTPDARIREHGSRDEWFG